MDQQTEKKDDVSLKEIINSIQSFGAELIKFWWVLLFGGLLGAAYLGYKAYKTDPIYIATLTFMLNEDTGAPINAALSGILGRIGGTGGKYNLEKILELSRSRVILEKVLFAKTTIANKNDFIANHISELYKIKPDTSNSIIKFNQPDPESFTKDQNSQLIKIYNYVTGPKGIIQASTNEKSGIMNLQVQSINEELSIVIADTLFAKLSQFYIDKSIEKELVTYNLLKRRVEQLYGQMNSQITSAVALDDKTLGVWQQSTKLPQIRYDRDARISGLMYSEALKNLELADFSLKSKTPFIQLLDSPIAPLEVTKSSTKKNILFGGIIGIIMMSIIIILRKIIRVSLQ